MRFWKRFCALLLAAALLFSLGGCSLFTIDNERLETIRRNNGTKFSEMEYERPDTEEIRDCVDNICDMLDSGEDYDAVTDALDEFYILYWNFYTMYTLAEIRSDIDTSDKYYGAEYEYCMTADADIYTMFNELMVACYNSDLGEELDESYFGGMLAEDYSGDYEDGFEKLNSLYAQENVLLNDYRNLLVEFYSCADEDEAYLTYNEEMCQIYIELVKVRHKIAAEYGFDSYEELAYAQYGREYTPDDLEEYLAAIKEYIVPLFIQADNEGVLSSAYYRLDDIDSEDALGIVADTVSGMDNVFKKSMDFMLECELYDVSYSKNKLDSSYVIYIDDYNSPFLFVNPTGYAEDVLTIAHEFGHFTDSYENFDMTVNLDTSETLSQGMEYMLLCYMNDRKLSRDLAAYKMTDVLYLYVNQACFNEFEHRVFSLPESELTVDRVNSIYAECATDYGFGENYGDVLEYSWIDVSHFFDYPFYIISYCISDSAAFRLYCMELEAPGSGLEAYLSILDDAENMSFLEVLEEAGMDSPITADTIKDIAEVIADKLKL